MGAIKDKDLPSDVVRKVIDEAAGGYWGFIKSEGELGLNKLRLAGVYDDRQIGYFMFRTRVPGGRLTYAQASTIGMVADKFAIRPSSYVEEPERFLEITTRQDIQIHWIRLEDLPEIWRMYESVGLTSVEACGNTTRNVTCCPASGVDGDELIEAYPLVQKITRYLLDHPEASAFLPRKFKTAIGGSREDCMLHRIHDIAFTAAESHGVIGFNVWVGGGLSDYPRMASPLNAFVTADQILEVLLACLQTFMALGDYTHAAVNRFRMVVEQLGVDRIRSEIQRYTSFQLQPAGRNIIDGSVKTDHIGVFNQKQHGLCYVGLNVPVGRMQGEDLTSLAALGEKFGNGELRLTQKQNILIANVPKESLPRLLEQPLLRIYTPKPSTFERASVACTGAPFCKFAVHETKGAALQLAKRLDSAFPHQSNHEFTGLRIHTSGCRASCAQLQIADIALRANVGKDENSFQPAFDIGIGGNSSGGQLIRWVGLAVPFTDVPSIAKYLLEKYLKEHRNGLNFSDFYNMMSLDELQGMITSPPSAEATGA